MNLEINSKTVNLFICSFHSLPKACDMSFRPISPVRSPKRKSYARDSEDEKEPLQKRSKTKDPISEPYSYPPEPLVELNDLRSEAHDAIRDAIDGESEEKKQTPQYRPLPLEINPFDGKDHLEEEYDRKHPEYNDYCALCWHKITRSDLVESTHFKYWVQFIENNWGQSDPIWLMNRAQDLYNVSIRSRTKRKWPFFRRMIFEHYISHDLRPRFLLELQELTFRTVLRQMLKGGDLFEQSIENPSLVRCKPKELRTFREIAQYHRQIHKETVEYRGSRSG